MAAETSHETREILAIRRADGESRTLAASLPRLVLEARRIAANVIHGLHGRRRAGAGESFWQYRRFVSGEPSQNVDWRRSARDDHLYVREQEWEAAHTVWLWPDRSLSMAFASKGARDSKLERGLIVTSALAELLVAGGERVGIPGLMTPTASRSVIDKMAQAMLHDEAARLSLPPSFVPSALAETRKACSGDRNPSFFAAVSQSEFGCGVASAAVNGLAKPKPSAESAAKAPNSRRRMRRDLQNEFDIIY